MSTRALLASLVACLALVASAPATAVEYTKLACPSEIPDTALPIEVPISRTALDGRQGVWTPTIALDPLRGTLTCGDLRAALDGKQAQDIDYHIAYPPPARVSVSVEVGGS